MKIFRNFKVISIILISLIIFFLLLFGINYFNKRSYASNSDIKVTFGNTGNSNVITNELPLSDTIGKSYEYEESNKFVGYNIIRISSLVDYPLEYEIYIVKKNNSNTIDDKYIKFYLSDNNFNALDGYKNNVVPSVYDLINSKNSSADIILYKHSLKAKKTDNIIVKSWLSEVYSLNKDLKKFSYEIKVRVI